MPLILVAGCKGQSMNVTIHPVGDSNKEPPNSNQHESIAKAQPSKHLTWRHLALFLRLCSFADAGNVHRVQTSMVQSCTPLCVRNLSNTISPNQALPRVEQHIQWTQSEIKSPLRLCWMCQNCWIDATHRYETVSSPHRASGMCRTGLIDRWICHISQCSA